MIKLINYDNLNSLILNKGQNEIGESLMSLYNTFGSIKTLEDVEHFCIYVKNNFIHDGSMRKFERTSEEIAKSKIWSGCSDFGTLVSPVLRMNKIPTVYVQTASISWISEYQKNYEKLMIMGHIFLEVYIDNKWYLLDANNGRVYLNYNKDNYNLPNGFIAYSKSLNGHEVGCKSPELNRKIIEDYFKEYDTSSYINPEYEEIRFMNLNNRKV